MYIFAHKVHKMKHTNVHGPIMFNLKFSLTPQRRFGTHPFFCLGLCALMITLCLYIGATYYPP